MKKELLSSINAVLNDLNQVQVSISGRDNIKRMDTVFDRLVGIWQYVSALPEDEEKPE